MATKNAKPKPKPKPKTKKPKPAVGAIAPADQTGQAWQRGVGVPCAKNE